MECAIDLEIAAGQANKARGWPENTFHGDCFQWGEAATLRLRDVDFLRRRVVAENVGKLWARQGN
jgi:hypothetical protein